MHRAYEDALIKQVHPKVDLGQYQEALYGSLKIGSLDFWQLATYCQKKTGTTISKFKSFRRFDRLFVLLRFLLRAIESGPGHIAECGVLRGFSALAMGRLLASIDPSGSPREIWLIDSYEGLSEPRQQDRGTWMEGDKFLQGFTMQKGFFATPLEAVQENLSELRTARFAKGWVPEVFGEIAQNEWSFVHLDFDLYEPIRDSLEYFYPRLEKGGVMLNDDFSSALFPGAGKAWREFFAKIDKGYVILDTGQAVYINS